MGMEIKIGDIIAFKHYQGMQSYFGLVCQINERTITIKPFKEPFPYSFFEGDPIAVTCKINDEIYFCECMIGDINIKELLIDLRMEGIKSNHDQRLCDRFPVSLYADIKDRGRKSLAYVKNISIGGVAVVSKWELTIGQDVDIDILLGKNFINLKGVVVRKASTQNYFEYGLRFTSHEFSTVIESYIQEFREDHEKTIKQIKLEYKNNKNKN